MWDETERPGSLTTTGSIVTVKLHLWNGTWLWSTERLQETPPSMPLYPPQIPHSLHQDSTVISS